MKLFPILGRPNKLFEIVNSENLRRFVLNVKKKMLRDANTPKGDTSHPNEVNRENEVLQ